MTDSVNRRDFVKSAAGVTSRPGVGLARTASANGPDGHRQSDRSQRPNQPGHHRRGHARTAGCPVVHESQRRHECADRRRLRRLSTPSHSAKDAVQLRRLPGPSRGPQPEGHRRGDHCGTGSLARQARFCGAGRRQGRIPREAHDPHDRGGAAVDRPGSRRRSACSRSARRRPRRSSGGGPRKAIADGAIGDMIMSQGSYPSQLDPRRMEL